VWKLPQPPEAPQRIGHTPSSSKEAFLWFSQWATGVRKNQVTWIQTADTDITSHVEILSRTHDAQAAELQTLQQRIDMQREIQKVIEARIHAITEWQLNLTLRADNVLNFINSCQARLSKAEREYFGELESMNRSVQTLSSRVEDAERQVEVADSATASAPGISTASLPESQLKMMEPWIEKQYVFSLSRVITLTCRLVDLTHACVSCRGDLIDNTIDQLKRLSTEVDR
jgi:hypothetical protein